MAQKQGGTLTVGLELDILGFDPLKVGVYDTAGNIAASLIFDTLTSLDDNGKAQPKLAVSWSSSEDYKTWTYKLRPDVKFQDGTPFNAEAVVWNFNRQKDPKNNCRCAFYVSVHQQRRGQGRADRRLQSARSGGEHARAAGAAGPEQRRCSRRRRSRPRATTTTATRSAPVPSS